MKAICDGIATRYSSMTPPSGETLRAAYGQYPKSMPNTPAIVVQPVTGEGVVESSMWVWTHSIDLGLYLSKRPGDPSRVEVQRQKWLGPLLARLDAIDPLGLVSSGVKSALPIGYEWTELLYGADQYDAILVHLQIITRQATTFS